MTEVGMIAVLIAMILTLTRAFIGPSLYDRILSVNSFGTLTVLFIVVHGFLNDRPEFLDLAIVYGLLNFIGTVAVLKFFGMREYGSERERKATREL